MGKKINLWALWALLGALLMAGCTTDESGQDDPKPETIPAPAKLEITNATTSSLTFTWQAVEGATAYSYKYKDTAGKLYITDQTSECEVTISGLDSGKEYRFAVRADKGEVKGTFTEWLSAFTSVEGGGDNPDGGNQGGDGGHTGGDNSRWQLPENENDGVVRAFPGAEGGGMYTTGGRGGVVYHVTNLNDSGAGSLREAINKSGARTIVFDVAGTIHLKSNLKIKNGDLTIAGQTAPGDGICVAGGTIQIDADNIIVRYLRFRLGDEGSSLSDGSDAFWGRYHNNIIIDHCSMSWAIDEVGSFYANRNFTMQWCLLAEALRSSGHSKGDHGYGGIWGGKNASFHHNMLAHNDSRNARIDHPNVYGSYLESHRGHVDYRNNVIYNWGGNSTYGGEGGWWNIVGNYYKPGPASSKKNYFVDAYGKYDGKDVGYGTMYLSGNYHAGDYATEINANNWSGVYLHNGTGISNASSWQSYSPLAIKADDTTPCYTTTHSAEKAFERVCSYAGASLRRDGVDSRIAEEARTGTVTYKSGSNGSKNGMIDSQSDVGGWPTLSATDAELRETDDSDGDGIPDSWEREFGLNMSNAGDGNAYTLDADGRYTNLEIYLHYLVKEITAAQTQNGVYQKL